MFTYNFSEDFQINVIIEAQSFLNFLWNPIFIPRGQNMTEELRWSQVLDILNIKYLNRKVFMHNPEYTVLFVLNVTIKINFCGFPFGPLLDIV